MTEDEARAKWCCGPPALAIATVVAHNLTGVAKSARGSFVDGGFCCRGSDCMAWRWNVLPGQRERMVEDANSTAGVRTERWTEVGDGYCGLAGTPQ